MAILLVNGEAIEEAEIRRETAAMLTLMTERMPRENPAVLRTRAREWAEENLIEAALLRQAAAQGPESEDDPKVRLDKLIARITAPAAPPRHKDVVSYYLKNRDSFEEPEKIHAAHIVKNVDEQHSEAEARVAIEHALDELTKGRPFAEVADELSDCPGNGGDLGLFGRGEMVPVFEKVVFNLETKAVSGIFRSEFGFHIATVLERKPAGIRRLEDVRSQIEDVLLREKKQKRLDQYVDQLRARARIRRQGAA
jgi:parvulin-like peptidyl-prolyl isomerase